MWNAWPVRNALRWNFWDTVLATQNEDPAGLAHSTYPQALSVADFRSNLATVNGRIVQACKRVGRDASTVRLLPVSKTVDAARIRLSYEAGIRQLGENKVQEAHSKWELMRDLPDLHWSVIGHLQTNKAKVVARFASEFQALDSLRVAEELDRRLQADGRSLDVFVQVNTSGEDSKYGLAPEAVAQFLRAMPAYSALRVRGLMTLAMFSADVALVRPCFVRLRELRDQLRQTAPQGVRLDDLSMGMSGDFEVAIEEGATVVRVGQAIYGSRAQPDSFYWPARP
ncbi:YggS family pyridoxal phosphate-dependent enzyme [Achromobacter deleyi]|nr:YggS family pyridoxal phosphate-dependent enzyme [Achromobacter deleyi]